MILSRGGTAQLSVSNVYRKMSCSSRKDEHPTSQAREGEEQELVFGRKGIIGGKPPHRISSLSPNKLQQQ